MELLIIVFLVGMFWFAGILNDAFEKRDKGKDWMA